MVSKWNLSKSFLIYIYPDHKNSYIPVDLLIFTTRFLCHIKSEYYDNGQILYKHSYVNGKRHGVDKAWWENGQIEYKHFYVKGKKHGVCKGWYDNGQILYKHSYVNGKRHGLFKGWRLNGLIKYKIHYVNGKNIVCGKNGSGQTAR